MDVRQYRTDERLWKYLDSAFRVFHALVFKFGGLYEGLEGCWDVQEFATMPCFIVVKFTG